MASAEVIEWYDRKTDSVLQKYGPGPRYHFHAGLVDPSVEPARDVATLMRQLVKSQEDMLWRSAAVWDADRYLRGKIIDVGAGLGGGAIFWAQEFGATVTALTPVPRHIPLIARFAKEAGVEDKVIPELGDAHSVPGTERFDAAVTSAASNYFDRRKWFECLRRTLRPGGRVFIEDSFLGRPELAAPFNEYWISNIGSTLFTAKTSRPRRRGSGD